MHLSGCGYKPAFRLTEPPSEQRKAHSVCGGFAVATAHHLLILPWPYPAQLYMHGLNSLCPLPVHDLYQVFSILFYPKAFKTSSFQECTFHVFSYLDSNQSFMSKETWRGGGGGIQGAEGIALGMRILFSCQGLLSPHATEISGKGSSSVLPSCTANQVQL